MIRRIAGGYADRLITVVFGQVVRGTVYGILGTADRARPADGVRPLADRGAAPGATRPPSPASLSVLPIGAPLVWIPVGTVAAQHGDIRGGRLFLVALRRGRSSPARTA